MDQKKLDNLPYIRSLTKRVDVGHKLLNLAKKRHKFILLYDKTPYVKPDKKIVDKMMSMIPIEDYDDYLKSGSKQRFHQVVLNSPENYLTLKDAGLLMLGYELILAIRRFTTEHPDIKEKQYQEFIGGNAQTVAAYYKEMDILGKLYILGCNILKLMKKEYPKQYQLFTGSGIVDISDFERYIQMRQRRKKGLSFNEAKKGFEGYLQKKLKEILTPKQFFLVYIANNVKKSIFGQRMRLID